MKVPSQFTPLFQSVILSMGLTIAAVYGLIWRYNQMDEGVCSISMDKMSALLGIDRRTVIRSINKLKSGPNPYILDLTPILVNRPHRYKISGRIQSDILSLSDQFAVSESHTIGTPESQPGVTESHLIKDLIDSKDINILYLWENLVIFLLHDLSPGSVLSHKLHNIIPLAYIDHIFTVQVPNQDLDWVKSRLTAIVNRYLLGLNPPGVISFVPYNDQ